jgi:hypothetical protein
MGCLLLCNQFSSIELHQHSAIRLEFFHWHRKSKVVKNKELEFEVIEFHKRKTADLEFVSIFCCLGWRMAG